MAYQTLVETEIGQRLHPEQDYVFEIAGDRKIPVRVLRHYIKTKTCDEKAAILRWSPERVVKALYFRDGSYSDLVAVVTPELHKRVEIERIIPGKKYVMDPHFLPRGMTMGTCTPFPYESVMEDEVSKIFIVDHPTIDDQLVDISVGGTDEQAFKTSMHLPYRAIYDILKYRFGEKVTKV